MVMAMDATKHSRLFMAVAALILPVLAGHAQIAREKLDKKIIVRTESMRIDSLLDLVARQTGIEFSFNSKKINPSKHIPVKKGSQKLADCLSYVRNCTGIYFAAIGEHIILIDNPPQARHALVLTEKAPVVVLAVARQNETVSRTRTNTTSNSGRLRPNPRPVSAPPPPRTVTPPPVAEAKGPDMHIYPVRLADVTESSFNITEPKSPAIKPEDLAATASGNTLTRPGRERKWTLAVAFNVSKPSFATNMTGIGGEIQAEFPFRNNSFSVVAGTSYNFFYGRYLALKDSTGADTSSLRNFANIPVLLGMRYYVAESVFFSAEGGLAISANKTNKTHAVVVPSAGYRLGLRRTYIDMSLKFMRVIGKETLTENIPYRGNYNIWSLRLAYVF